MIKFKSTVERDEWLKGTAGKIAELDFNRRVAVMKGEFEEATKYMKARDMAKKVFGQVQRAMFRERYK